jgi:oxygen-dependent protoporphyrinogen oxidase
VVVVGAGVSGLAVARELLQRRHGVDVTLLERSDRPGGPLRSEDCDGFVVEHGPTGFLDGAPATLALVRELGLGERLLPSDARARRRYVFRRGRLHAVPGSPKALLSSGLLSWTGRLRLALEPWAPAAEVGDESVHRFVERRLGREAACVLSDAVVSGVFAGDPRRLSLSACFPQLADMERVHGGLLRAALARRKAGGATLGRLTSFPGGTEELVRALARELGPALALRTSVAAVRLNGGGARYRVERAAGPPLEADAVVLACPARQAAELLRPIAPATAGELQAIAAAPLAVVALGYEAARLPRPLDGFGFLVPRGEGPRALGVLWDSSIFPGRAPSGRVLLRVMLGGAHDDVAVQLGAEELIGLARRDLSTALGIAAEPCFTRVIRHRPGIPQYELGHIERLARIEDRLAALPGIVLAGSAYRGVSLNACIAEAIPAAERVLAALARLPATAA